MIENEVGRMVYYWIEKIGTKFQDVQCYDTIVMPNHIHIIIQLMNHDTNKLSSIIQWFKTNILKELRVMVGNHSTNDYGNEIITNI